MNKKKLLALVLVVALLLTAIGGTLAYLTDTEEAINTFTVGDVNIQLLESKIYTNNAPDTTDDDIREDAKTYAEYLKEAGNLVVPGREFMKAIYIDNVGKNTAYVRVRLVVTRDQFNAFYFTENTTALENGKLTKGIIAHYANGLTKDYSSAVSGKTTDFTAIKADAAWTELEYIYTYTDSLAAKDLTDISPVKCFTMKYDLDNEDLEGLKTNTNIKVYADAIQAEGFADAEAAFAAFDKQEGYVSQEAFQDAMNAAKPGDIINIGNTTVLVTDIPAGVTISGNGADKTSVNVPANSAGERVTGLVINQAGAAIKDVTLVKNDEISSWEYAGVVAVKVGNTTFDGVVIHSTEKTAAIVVNQFSEGTVTIANSTLTSAWKALHIVDGANGKVVIDNTTIDSVYTFNVNSSSSQDLVIEVTNSTLKGWTSYGDIKSASFTKVTFGKGHGQAYLRPASDTTMTDCTFEEGFMMGYSSATEKSTITLNNCTYNGVKLTAENIIGLLVSTSDSPDYGYMKENVTLIVDGVTVTYQ